MSKLWEAVQYFASTKPSEVVIMGDNENVTWDGLNHRVSSLVNELMPYEGKVIGLYAENSPDWIVIDLACQQAGIILLPLPSFFSKQQLSHAIKSSGAQAIMVSNTHELKIKELSLDNQCNAKKLSSTTSTLKILDTTFHKTLTLPKGTQKITFTSGSTGQPKGVCLSLLSQINTSQALVDALDLSDVIHLAVLPFSTLLENIAGIYAPLITGGKIIALSQKSLGFNGSQGFDLNKYLGVVTHYQPSSLILLPELLTAMLGAIEQGWVSPKSLKFIAVGGSKVSQNLLTRAQVFGLPVYQGYGLSECTSVVSLNTPKHSNIESTGRVLKHVDLAIEQGEVVVLGNGFLGYIGQPETWYKNKVYTGDFGELDEQGYLHITGRKKNVLVSSFGRNISPEWVEGELLSNGLLSQCIVLGDAKPFCIALVFPRSSETQESEIENWVDHVNQMLPDYAQIKKWGKLRSAMTPEDNLMTTNGKPVRQNIIKNYQDIIKQLYEGEYDAPVL